MKTKFFIGETRETKFNNIATIELAVAMLFSGSAFLLCQNINTILRLLLLLDIIIFFSIVIKYYGYWPKHRKRSSKLAYSVLIIIFFSALLNIHNASWNVTGRCVFGVLASILLFLLFDNKKNAMEAFVHVMYFYAIVGIIFWILFTVSKIPEALFPIITSTSNESVQYNSIIIFGKMVGTTRNCGPFWEPSIYAGYLMIAMYFSHFFLEQRKKVCIVLCIALLTAQSSGGFLLLILFLVACVWNKQGADGKNIIILRVASIIIMIVVLIFWDYIAYQLVLWNPEMFSKIFEISTNGSSLTRLQSVTVDLNIWKKSIILGVGVDRLEILFLQMRDIIATISGMAHTSTSTEYIAAFGVGGIWINYLWIRGLVQEKKNIVWKIIMIISFVLILNESPQINFVYTYFVLFVLGQENNLTKGKDINVKDFKEN